MLLAIRGPRQSGKFTLRARAFADKSLGLLESIEAREQALEDPVGFLARYPRGAVIDHAQRAPLLFSELQIGVDRRPGSGRWVPTGSTHVHLHSSIRRVARRAHRVARASATVARGTPARLRRERARGVRHQRIPAHLRPGPRRDHLARRLHHDLRRARRALRAQRRKPQHSLDHSRPVRRTRGTAPQQLRSRPDAGVKYETARARISVLEALHRVPTPAVLPQRRQAPDPRAASSTSTARASSAACSASSAPNSCASIRCGARSSRTWSGPRSTRHAGAAASNPSCSSTATSRAAKRTSLPMIRSIRR